MNPNHRKVHACGSREHIQRRSFLRIGGAAGISLLSPVAAALARNRQKNSIDTQKSLIVLWLEGAPSQLETFDPHPGTAIAAGSKARKTKAKDILIGDGFEQVADQMDSISLVRAVTSKEGDHARAIYNIKTGFRPDPTLVHPSIGSVVCHQTLANSKLIDIPRHISILPGNFPGRGGYLGDPFDAFKIGDPQQPVPDIQSMVDKKRQMERINDLSFVDSHFLSRHQNNSARRENLKPLNLDLALNMMSSEQLEAFDVSHETDSVREQFGDTPFGRGCLAATRLIQAGVKCIEITLGGWDTHVNNHELQAGRIKILDPAFAATIRELKRRDLLDSTLVLCGGEFGRTPFLNPVGGRDHWPQGFAVAMAGGGIKGGRVVGETNPTPNPENSKPLEDLTDAQAVEDIHATIYKALGINFKHELDTPIGRPMKISEGKPIDRLLDP